MIIIGKFQDLTGQKFGKLTVIERAENDKQNRVRWLCQCECGNLHITQATSLKRGACRSCGCEAGFTIYNQRRKEQYKNIYDLSGEYGVGYTAKGEKFYFDLEDYDKIKEYCWHKNKDGYIVTTINNHSKISFHRLVMNVTNPLIQVDHIYHRNNDNRKSQLRLVTNQQNQFNVSKQKNNTSGHTGVYWHKKHQQWEVLLQYNGKLNYLGLYDNIEDAIDARRKAEMKYFGEYRYRENLS